MRRILLLLFAGAVITALLPRDRDRRRLSDRARELAEDVRLALADGRHAASERRAELETDLAGRLAESLGGRSRPA